MTMSEIATPLTFMLKRLDFIECETYKSHLKTLSHCEASTEAVAIQKIKEPDCFAIARNDAKFYGIN